VNTPSNRLLSVCPLGLVWDRHPDGHPQHMSLNLVLEEITAMCEHVARRETSAYKGSNALEEAP